MKNPPPHALIAASLLLSASSLSAATLSHTASGTGTLTRSSIISLNVTTATGLIITEFQHQTRGDSVPRDFLLYYRAGQFDELINIGTPDEPEILPAHRVESAWTQISLVENVANPSNAMTTFTLNLNDAAGGTLALSQGFYSFMFHSLPIDGGNANGVRTVTLEGSPGTILDSDPNLALIAQVSKGGSAFGTSTPTERVPGQISITYIPEPSTALLAGLGLILGFRRSRRQA